MTRASEEIPANDDWTRLTDVNAPAPRIGHVTIWAGDEMIVTGHAEDDGRFRF